MSKINRLKLPKFKSTPRSEENDRIDQFEESQNASLEEVEFSFEDGIGKEIIDGSENKQFDQFNPSGWMEVEREFLQTQKKVHLGDNSNLFVSGDGFVEKRYKNFEGSNRFDRDYEDLQNFYKEIQILQLQRFDLLLLKIILEMKKRKTHQILAALFVLMKTEFLQKHLLINLYIQK